MINVQDLAFAYGPLYPGKPPTQVFRYLDLHVDRADARAVMGAGGSGKSTLGYILAGVAPRYTGGRLTGMVEVAGIDPGSTRTAKPHIGLLFQDAAAQLFTTTAEEEIAWGLEARGVNPDEIDERVSLALARFGLSAKAERPPWALSGGEQKRLALASLWAVNPSLLILDEPLGGLDPEGKRNVLEAVQDLRQDGTTLLILTLRPQAAMQATAISLLTGGSLAPPCSPDDLLTDGERLIEAGVIYPPHLWPDLHAVAPPREEDPALVVEDLHHAYQGQERALRGVSFTVPRGQFVALVGPNGAGKSTLIRHFNGLLRPSRGKIYVMGKDTEGRSTGEIARDISYVFQRPEQQLFAATVREEIAYGPQCLQLPDVKERTRRALARFSLEEVAETPPALLAYGAQRAVTLASVSALDTPIVTLDEPTVGLDGRGLNQLLEWLSALRRAGVTIILITHEMALASRADRVVALAEGQIVADGDPKTVIDTLDWHGGEP